MRTLPYSSEHFIQSLINLVLYWIFINSFKKIFLINSTTLSILSSDGVVFLKASHCGYLIIVKISHLIYKRYIEISKHKEN